MTKTLRDKRPWVHSWDEEAHACMHYLHLAGKANAARAACLYEYARESGIARKAAGIRDELFPKRRIRPKDQDAIQDAIEASLHQDLGCLLPAVPWWLIPLVSNCFSFPTRPWTVLDQRQRESLLAILPWRKSVGLYVERWSELQSLAEETEDPHAESVRVDGAKVKVLLALNFQFKKNQLMSGFGAWLERPENKMLLSRYAKSKVGQTGNTKDALKSLAVWRLLDRLGFNGMITFTTKNRIREATSDRPLPFHDSRAGQTDKARDFDAPLYRDEATAVEARRRAQKFLENLFPGEVV